MSLQDATNEVLAVLKRHGITPEMDRRMRTALELAMNPAVPGMFEAVRAGATLFVVEEGRSHALFMSATPPKLSLAINELLTRVKPDKLLELLEIVLRRVDAAGVECECPKCVAARAVAQALAQQRTH